MEKISWTDCDKNEVLHRVKVERHILPTIKGLKAYWIGHTLRRNCLVKHGMEGQIEGRLEVRGRRGRRHRQLLDDLKEMRGYYKLKKEALNRTVWRTGFGRGCGPGVRQSVECMEHVRVQKSLQNISYLIICSTECNQII